MDEPERTHDPAARWERVQSLFHAAAGLPAAGRDAFVRDACGADAALCERVLELLAADAGGHALLEGGIAAAAGAVMGEGVPLPRQAFGPYRVTGVLGEGGMGVVYRARRDDVGGEAAIKILRDAALSPARRERFAFEQRALAQLDHPSIARLYDADMLADGTPWFAMELVEGVPLTEHCRSRALGVEARLRLFREVCDAVQHAHARAILHRDLKPSNILVRPDGHVKLVDFGISKPLDALLDGADATRTGLRFMTPAYAAPEQVRGGPLGVHTDVYALGVVLYELLAGALPFDLAGCTPSEAATVLAEQVPRRPSSVAAGRTGGRVPGGPGRAAWNDLDVLCATAMHRDPERRYRTVDALARDVDRYLSGQPLEARGDPFGYRAGKFLRRHAAAVGAAAAALVLLVGVVAFYTFRLAEARDRARDEAARTRRIQGFMSQLFQGDSDAGPADTLRVITMLDRGERQARGLSAEPAVQAEFERTLGGIEQALGRFDRADALLESALAHTLRLRRPGDADVVHSLTALALLRSEQARFDEAERFARRALAEARRTLPAGHAGETEAIGVLGRVLADRGAYDAALPQLREAVRRMSAGGRTTQELATTLTDLAIAYFNLGRLAEADSLDRRLLAMSRELNGPRHPNVADDLINLAATARARGRYAEALHDDRAALDILRGWFGPASPRTADAETIVARDLVFLERYAEADTLLGAALDVTRRAYGPDHPLVAGTLNEIGNVALSEEHVAQAESCFRAAADIYRRRFGAHHADVAIALANLGSTYLSTGENRRAEACFREALDAYAGAVPPGHMDVGIARIKLGRALLRQKRFAEGERETLGGYRILVPQADPGISFLRAARKDLVADYEALGRPADAARFRAELADTSSRR